jgi:hypothetical protein
MPTRWKGKKIVLGLIFISAFPFSFAKRKNFEMAIIPFLWLLSNQKLYRNVFRITFWV